MRKTIQQHMAVLFIALLAMALALPTEAQSDPEVDALANVSLEKLYAENRLPLNWPRSPLRN